MAVYKNIRVNIHQRFKISEFKRLFKCKLT